jgi:uncharacterized protein YcbK (DUF882 family)
MGITRRGWAAGVAGGIVAAGLAPPALAQPALNRLRLRRSMSRLHVVFVPTGREWRGFWDPAARNEEAAEALTSICADHRTGARVPIDYRLWSGLALIGGEPDVVRWEVVSAYRSYASNLEVGGALDSQHRRGRALDLRLPAALLEPVAERLQSLRFGGVGRYPTHGFVHFDTRGTPANWVG